MVSVLWRFHCTDVFADYKLLGFLRAFKGRTSRVCTVMLHIRAELINGTQTE